MAGPGLFRDAAQHDPGPERKLVLSTETLFTESGCSHLLKVHSGKNRMTASVEVETNSPSSRGILPGIVKVLAFLLAMLLIRTFIVIPYWIPSGSMKPTLLVGDFMI